MYDNLKKNNSHDSVHREESFERNKKIHNDVLSSSESDLKKLNISNNSSNQSFSSIINSTSNLTNSIIATSTTWKIKAIIDSKNLLIPVS